MSAFLPRAGPVACSRSIRRVCDSMIEKLEQRRLLTLADPLGVIPGMTSGANPPDTVMDVGPNHVIQMVNSTRYQIWDKHGNSLFGPISFGSLWAGPNPQITPDPGNQCQNDIGDPIVVYDHLADRWLLSQFHSNGFDANNNPIAPFGMAIAVSQSPDPVNGADGIANNGDEWFLYRFDTPGFPDYPKFGVWPDAYYMSSFEGTLGIYAFDRTRMLNGDGTATFVRATLANPTPVGGFYRNTRILPTDLDGVVPAAGTPNFFVRTVDDNQDNSDTRDRVEIYSAVPNFGAGTLAFNLVEDLDAGDGLTAFDIMQGNRSGIGPPAPGQPDPRFRDMIPQPGTIDTLDSLSNRPMMQLKFRNFGTHIGMVFNQTVDEQNFVQAQTGFDPALEVAGIRWYELRSTDSGANWAFQQQGDFAPQPALTAENQIVHRWMGSAAWDADGNIAIAYSVTNSDNTNPIFPGMRYAARLVSDPAGQLSQGERIIFNGTNFQGNGNTTVEPQRWGDYSALSVDPVDDHKFWYTTHAANGITRVTAFFVDESPPGFQVSGGMLTVFGDQLAANSDDDIRLVRHPTDANDLLVFVNGTGPIADYRIDFSLVQQIKVMSGGGNDTLTLDFGSGNFLPKMGADIDGEAGSADRLNILGAGLSFSLNGTTFTTPTGEPINFTNTETLGLRNGFFAASGTIPPNVEVGSLATLTGVATIQGTLSALAGGTVAPGNSGPGILTAGGLVLSAGSTVRLEVNGLAPGTQHDQFVVNGAVSLGGATLDVNLGFIPLPGQDIVIIRNDLADAVTGTFAQGSLATFGTTKFAIDYTFPADADGFKNDVAMIRFGAALGPDPCVPGQQALFVSASTGDDLIRIIPNTGTTRMEVLINGTSEGIFRPGSGNHGLIIVYGQDGNDLISIEMPSRDVLVYGNDGNDTIRTGNNNGILLGGDDNDLLVGGNQDDLLIGGRGADRLEANNGRDILVAGFSSFEGNTPANQLALCNILDGANLFNATNVFDDTDIDILLGGHGQDRFFLNLTGGVALDISDRSGSETATDLL